MAIVRPDQGSSGGGGGGGTVTAPFAGGRAPRWITGAYYGPLGAAESAGGALSANFVYGVPFPVPVAHTFDRIGLSVFSAATAATVIRLGIYRDDGLVGPDALVLDAGTVAGDTTGRKEITISQALTADLYWLVAVAQLSGGTPPNVRRLLNSGFVPTHLPWAVFQGQSANFDIQSFGFLRAGVAGALPANLTPVRADLENTGDMPFIMLRA